MKRKSILLALFAVVLAASLGGTASAAGNPASGNKLQCFSGTVDGGFGGTCTLNGGGSATLDTTDGNVNGSYAGVYITPGLPGKPIGTLNKLSFDYACTDTTGATNCVAGGSPRLSVPIDENADGVTEAYAFIDANNCGQAGAASGTVGLSCPVYYGPTGYANWAAFAAANPTYRFGSDSIPFVIADQPFRGTISNVQLGKAAAK